MKKHNDQKIDEVLGDLVNKFKLKPKLNQVKIKDVWAEMMGPSITKYTKKISLRRNKLYVTIESAPLRQELSYGKDKLLDLLNEKLGEEYIEAIIIK